MNNAEYVENVLLLESPVTDALVERVSSVENIRLLHAGLGMATESGEFIDMLKKAIFYGKPIDKVNLQEELGDLLWYISLASSILGTDITSIMNTNIAKLQARYPEKFTEYHAENRDLATERKILEGKDCTSCEAQGVCGL